MIFYKILGYSIISGILLMCLACAPREATMCLKYMSSSSTASWVKCPKGVEPGTELNSPRSSTWKSTGR